MSDHVHSTNDHRHRASDSEVSEVKNGRPDASVHGFVIADLGPLRNLVIVGQKFIHLQIRVSSDRRLVGTLQFGIRQGGRGIRAFRPNGKLHFARPRLYSIRQST